MIHHPKKKNRLTVILYGSRSIHSEHQCSPYLYLYDNKTVLQRQVDIINEVYPNVDILVVFGCDSKRVIKQKPSNVRLVENQLWKETNELEDLRLAVNCSVGNNFLFINNSILFNRHALHIVEDISSSVSSFGHIGKSTIVDGRYTSFGMNKMSEWSGIFYITESDMVIFKGFLNTLPKTLYSFEALERIVDQVNLRATSNENLEIVPVRLGWVYV